MFSCSGRCFSRLRVFQASSSELRIAFPGSQDHQACAPSVSSGSTRRRLEVRPAPTARQASTCNMEWQNLHVGVTTAARAVTTAARAALFLRTWRQAASPTARVITKTTQNAGGSLPRRRATLLRFPFRRSFRYKMTGTICIFTNAPMLSAHEQPNAPIGRALRKCSCGQQEI